MATVECPALSMDAPMAVECPALCMDVHVFVFCVFLSALVSGVLVAQASFFASVMEWFSERAPAISRPRLQRVRLLGFNRVTTSELALNERGEVGEAFAPAFRSSSRSPGTLPPRVVRGCCGNRDEAQRRWVDTLKWREENAVDGILNEPQPLFHVMKQHFPSFVYGRGRKGQVVVYERLGRLNVQAMEEQGVTLPALLRHYVFTSEYIWRVVDPDDDAQLICVEDLKGVRIGDVTRKAVDFIRSAAKTSRHHYVDRCSKLFIVNAPPWFGLVWNSLGPFLDARTKRKVRVLGNDLSELQRDIDAAQLPYEYGGTCRTPLQDSPEERRLFMLVRTVNREYFRHRSLGGTASSAGPRRGSPLSAPPASPPPGEDEDCFLIGADVGLELAGGESQQQLTGQDTAAQGITAAATAAPFESAEMPAFDSFPLPSGMAVAAAADEEDEDDSEAAAETQQEPLLGAEAGEMRVESGCIWAAGVAALDGSLAVSISASEQSCGISPPCTGGRDRWRTATCSSDSSCSSSSDGSRFAADLDGEERLLEEEEEDDLAASHASSM